MLSIKTRKRIKEQNWQRHSNKAQFLKRIKEQCDSAFKDLALVAKELPEEQLEEIFTVDKINPLLGALLDSHSIRTILIAEKMAGVVKQKLVLELPNTLVNSIGGEIVKTWELAKFLSEYADKPLTKYKRQK